MITTEDIRIELISKHPHTTWGISIRWWAKKPTRLIKDLTKAGWNLSPFHVPQVPGHHELELDKPGSGLFQSWIPRERSQFLKEVKRILAANGVETYYRRKLQLQDLL